MWVSEATDSLSSSYSSKSCFKLRWSSAVEWQSFSRMLKNSLPPSAHDFALGESSGELALSGVSVARCGLYSLVSPSLRSSLNALHERPTDGRFCYNENDYIDENILIFKNDC